MCKSLGLIKKEVEFPGVSKKCSSGIPWALVFDLEISKGYHTISQNFPKWKLLFSGVSKGKVTNIKITGSFSRKFYPLVCPPWFHVDQRFLYVCS